MNLRFQEGGVIVLIAGLLVVYILGRVLDVRLRRLTGELGARPPEGMPVEKWKALLELPETFGGLSLWLGLLERTTYYALFWLGAPELIIGWLLFKLGCYWGIWRRPIGAETPEADADATDRLLAQSQHGDALAKLSLLGTLGNLLVAVLGVLAVMIVFWALALLGRWADALRS